MTNLYFSIIQENKTPKGKKNKNLDLNMETLILRSKNKEHLSILKAMAKALNVEVESEESPYDPAFVAKIRKSELDI